MLASAKCSPPCSSRWSAAQRRFVTAALRPAGVCRRSAASSALRWKFTFGVVYLSAWKSPRSSGLSLSPYLRAPRPCTPGEENIHCCTTQSLWWMAQRFKGGDKDTVCEAATKPAHR